MTRIGTLGRNTRNTHTLTTFSLTTHKTWGLRTENTFWWIPWWIRGGFFLRIHQKKAKQKQGVNYILVDLVDLKLLFTREEKKEFGVCVSCMRTRVCK
jgi:hypothetical protein